MRRLRFALLLGSALVGMAAGGSDRAAAQENFVSPNLANYLRNNIDAVGLADGRIIAVGKFTGRNANNYTSQSGARREQLRITMNGLSPSIDYELKTDKLRIVVDLDEGSRLQIVRSAENDSDVKHLEFMQPDEGPLTVVVGQDPETKKYEFATMWHLLVNEPELTAELEPLLRLLRPGWPLVNDGQMLEAALFKQVDEQKKYDRNEWAALVAQLRSPHYVERIEADRLLRELGKDVVPFLRSFLPSQLDAEQAYRIRMIVERYGTEARLDTVETAAERLASDPEVWYRLAARANVQQAERIRTQLSTLTGEEIEFDAAAAPEVKQLQLAKIRGAVDRVQSRPAK